MFVQGSICLQHFTTHTHITLRTFTQFAENSTVECMLALYGPTMHIATLKPYLQARLGDQSSSTMRISGQAFFYLVCHLLALYACKLQYYGAL